ncbi:MAG: hypothetical protein Q7R92_02745 [bacterium]|nr:hypothetical protein [bacterium]
MKKSTENKAIFWDYDLTKMDLKNPTVLVWYLNRKLQFGDLAGLKKADLKKYLPELNINDSLRELLANFLKKYA